MSKTKVIWALFLLNIVALFGIVYFLPPNNVFTITLFILLCGFLVHFIARLMVKTKRPSVQRVFVLYLPLFVSFCLFLVWQQIFEPLLLLTGIVVLGLLELLLGNISI